MLSGVDVVLGLTGVALQIVLATVLIRQRLWRKDFPLFFVYVCYAVVDVVGLILIARFSSKQTYFAISWSAQAIYAVLGLLAMNESFHKVFRVYYLRRSWFKFLVPSVVLLILAISTWRWLTHAPIQAGRLTVAAISFDLAANYMRCGVFGVFGILVIFWRTKWQRRPFGVMLGFGMFSIVGMIGDALRSDFGTKMTVAFTYAGVVAYIFACVLWLQAFRHAPDDKGNRPESNVNPAELLELLERHTEMLKRTKD